MRKAQITLFVLLALIIFISFSFIVYLNNEESKNKISKFEASFEPIENYANNCVRLSAQRSILGNALQGGFYNETNDVIFYSFFIMPVYSKGKTKNVPSLSKLKEQLEYSFDDIALSCIDGFKIFKDEHFEVNFEIPKSKATILQNEVQFDVDFSIIAKNKDIIKSFEKFSVSIPSRYMTVYRVADRIAEDFYKEPNKLCVSCLIDYANENELNISATNFGNATVVTIMDRKTKIGNENLIFNFAHSKGDLVE
ncbi:hypothetical protein HYX00_05005 [Candidatus Woesearchaeota archaeon]|nr:hypothetical protein [Candidatus Woesearchaeota archaeon]